MCLPFQVVESGLWLHDSGVLGASPDGLVGEDAIIEVKCPYSIRKATCHIKSAINSIKDYFVTYDEEHDEWEIDPNHRYWHQIQGQLHITKRKICYFILWTPNDHIHLDIPIDYSWGVNVDRLLKFYYEKMLPALFP